MRESYSSVRCGRGEGEGESEAMQMQMQMQMQLSVLQHPHEALWPKDRDENGRV